VLQIAHLIILNNAIGLEEAILGVSVVPPILRLGKQGVSIRDREVVASKGKK
jgi:hypothetical protein